MSVSEKYFQKIYITDSDSDKKSNMSFTCELKRIEDEFKTIRDNLNVMLKDLEEDVGVINSSVNIIDYEKYSKRIYNLKIYMKVLSKWYDDIKERVTNELDPHTYPPTS